RLRVFVLEPLASEHISGIISKAIARLAEDDGRPMGISEDALELLARYADGDARRALNTTDAVWSHAVATLPRGGNEITAELVTEVLERRLAQYDKSGEQHYNVISALHKAVRGSDVDGALYWLARMIEGGEDPLYIARRVVRMAAEDI